MKTICKFLIVILFFSVATVYANTIKDPILETVIREVIDKPSGPIYVKDLEGLTELFDAREWGIADLTGLEYCTNLEKLVLEENEITDISPLSKLVNLKELYLKRDEITNISPLVRNSGISKGDWVWLRGNPLKRKSTRIYISILRERGVTVGWDWGIDNQ